MENPEITSADRDEDFQLLGGGQVFHDYTIVSGRIFKVSAWWPPTAVPWEPGVYQGLIMGARGEKIIRYFVWDGTKWRSQRTGKFTTRPFEWRGLAVPEDKQF